MSEEIEPVFIGFLLVINFKPCKLSASPRKPSARNIHPLESKIAFFVNWFRFFSVEQRNCWRRKTIGISNQNSMISFDIIIAISFYLIAYMNTNERFLLPCTPIPTLRWWWWRCSPRLCHNSFVQLRHNSITMNTKTHQAKKKMKEKNRNSLFLFGNWEKLNYFIYSCFFGDAAVAFWMLHVFSTSQSVR